MRTWREKMQTVHIKAFPLARSQTQDVSCGTRAITNALKTVS